MEKRKKMIPNLRFEKIECFFFNLFFKCLNGISLILVADQITHAASQKDMKDQKFEHIFGLIGAFGQMGV